MLFAVSDHVVSDALVNLACHHTAIQQFVLGSVGAEAHNAPRPTARHPRDLQQFFQRRVIDIDARLRGRDNVRFSGRLLESACSAGCSGKPEAQHHDRDSRN